MYISSVKIPAWVPCSCRSQCLQGYVNAYAGIALPNPGSVGLHEAVGFEPVGIYRQVGYKLGAWHDVGWWQLRLQQPPSAPEVPRDSHIVQQTPGWDIALADGKALLTAKLSMRSHENSKFLRPSLYSLGLGMARLFNFCHYSPNDVK